MHSAELRCLTEWVQMVNQVKRLKAVGARITGKGEMGMKANGFDQWIRRGEEKAEAEAKMRSSLGFLRHRLAGMVWRAWTEAVYNAQLTRDKLIPIANKMMNRLKYDVFCGWVAYLVQVQEERKSAGRALGMWSGKLSTKCTIM